ncbi:MAG: glutathione transferase GstA [Pseudomonadota bacterium]
MKLYYSPGLCSLAPHIVAREAGLPITLVRVDINRHQTEHGDDFYRINPKGAVPVLELDNGERLTEGAIIAQYLADQAGDRTLMPAAGTLARYRVMEWQNYIATELHKAFFPLLHAELNANAKAQLVGFLRKKFEWVSEQLGTKLFLTGEQFTAADAYLFVVAGWVGYINLDLSDLDALQTFLHRIRSRPAVRAALQAEGLSS